MLRTTLILALSTAAAFAAPAAQRQPDRDEAKAAQELRGLVAGKPQSCISPSRSQGGSHYGNIVLLRDRSGTLYRTNFEGGCTVDDNDALISRRFSSQVCRGDIIEGRDLVSGFTRGSCVYSDFVPYRKPKS